MQGITCRPAEVQTALEEAKVKCKSLRPLLLRALVASDEEESVPDGPQAMAFLWVPEGARIPQGQGAGSILGTGPCPSGRIG